MYSHFYLGSDLTVLPVAALIMFIAFFGGVVASVFILRRDTQRYESLAALPFEDNGDNGDVERRGESHV